MSFDADTALHPAGPGTFDLDVPERWRVGRGATNGGFIAALFTRALQAVVAEPGRRPRSLTVHYPAACRPGPVRIVVAEERAGRSLTTLSARMTQDGALVGLALAAFAKDRSGPDFHHLPMPEAPPPQALEPWPMIPGRPSFARNWDYRPCIGAAPFSRAEAAVTGGWIRLPEPRPLDAPLLAAMADGWLPPVLPLLDGPRGVVPTIDLTVHFRASLPPDGMPDGAYSFALFESRLGAGGYWESDGVIWAPDGRVLAQARQLAMFALSG